MKPPYCLELPALPERRGQLLFTRSHTQHFTPFIMCAWVSSSVCVCFLWVILKKKKESKMVTGEPPFFLKNLYVGSQ